MRYILLFLPQDVLTGCFHLAALCSRISLSMRVAGFRRGRPARSS